MALERNTLETFALELVRTPSPSGSEGAVAALVRAELERLGYAVEVDALGNVVGTLDAGPGPCVLFDAHMDTVGVSIPRRGPATRRARCTAAASTAAARST